MTFANSLNPDQAGRFVGPDLDPNYMDLSLDNVMKVLKNLEKSKQTTRKHLKLTRTQIVINPSHVKHGIHIDRVQSFH